MVVEQEEVWLEVRLITSRQHVLRRWKCKVTQPRLSKVKAVMEEAMKHLMLMRMPHVGLEVVAVEPRTRSQTLDKEVIIKDLPPSWTRSVGRSSTVAKVAQSQPRT